MPPFIISSAVGRTIFPAAFVSGTAARGASKGGASFATASVRGEKSPAVSAVGKTTPPTSEYDLVLYLGSRCLRCSLLSCQARRQATNHAVCALRVCGRLWRRVCRIVFRSRLGSPAEERARHRALAVDFGHRGRVAAQVRVVLPRRIPISGLDLLERIAHLQNSLHHYRHIRPYPGR